MMATKLKFTFVLSILFCQSMFMSLATTTTTTSNGTSSATQQHSTSISQEGQTSQISPMSTGTTSNSAPDGLTSSTSVLTTLAQSSITSQSENSASNALATTSPLSASNTTVVASNLSPSEGPASSNTLNTTLSSSTPTQTSENSASNTSANSEEDSTSSGTESTTTTIPPPPAPQASDGTEGEITQSPSTPPSTTLTTIPTTTHVPFGDNCTKNEQCSTKGAECTHTKCSCNATSFYDISNGDICKPKLPYNSTCTEKEQCSTDGAECETSQCKCNNTSYFDNSNNVCQSKIPYNNTCSLQDQCLTRGAECEGNKCRCNETSFRDNSTNADACKLKLPYNSICTEKEQCSTDGADCKTNKCECNNTSYFDESYNTCELKANYSGDCGEESSQHDTQSEQCKTIGAICKGTCQCVEEYFHNLSNDTCLQKYNFKERCNDEGSNPSDQCKTTNAACISNTCQCLNDTFFYNSTSDSCDQKSGFNGQCNDEGSNPSDQCQTTNAVCKDNTCQCNDTLFHNSTSDSCDQKIAYEETCNDVATIPSSHCSTTQAYCINNTCLCKDGVYYKESTDSCEIRPVLDTAPIISNIYKTQFRIKWQKNDSYDFFITIYDVHHNMKECMKDLDFPFCTVNELNAGTQYHIEYYIKDKNRDVPSITNTTLTYTAPLPPPEPTSWERWEKNVTLRWDNNDHNCEYYILTITPPPSVGNNSVRIPGNEKLHNVIFDNLSGGINYTVTIKAVAGNNTASITPSHYTRPISVSNATTIKGQTSSSLDVHVVYNGLSSEQTKFIAYIDPPLTTEACDSCVNIIQQTCTKSFYCGATSILPITGLQDGTLYNLSIYAVLDGLTSENKYFIQEYTRPNGPSVPVIGNKTSSGFYVTYHVDSSNFDFFSIKVCSDNENICQFNQTTNITHFTASNLTAGTIYTVTVNTVLQNGLESLQPQSTSSFTRPNGPTRINVTQIHETNVTIEFNLTNNLYNHIEVDLYADGIKDKIKTVNGSIISGLQAATDYKIDVFTATITGLRSSESISKTFTTRPSKPDFAEFVNRSVNSITYNLRHTGKIDHFDILDEKGDLYTTIDSSSDRIFKADGLLTGTLYTYKVYANYSGLRSDSFIEIQNYTQPGKAMHLNLTRQTSTSMNSMWNAPDVGIVTHYQWTVTSLGPNKNSAEQTYNNTTNVTSLDINGLESGSICKVTVISQIVFNEKNISGHPVHFIDWCTIEEGPGKIESFTMYKATSESITIEWEKPSVRNGVIQSYEIEVLLDNIAENITLNCASCTIVPGEEDLDAIVQRCSNASVCDNAISDSKLRYNITELHPFRTYEMTVFAKTSQRGLLETSYFETEESVPSGPPSFTQHTPTATEIQITWNSPKYGDRNGIITTYNISYSYMEKTCTDDADSQIKSMNISLPDNSTSHLLTGLDPYTNYSVKIQASTKVGDGPFSDEIQILTLQSNPSKVRQLNSTGKNSESFLLNWMLPCRPNGEITYYTIFLTNSDNNAEWNINSTNTSINVTENILPYSNYSINVIGNTVVGEGDKTDSIRVTTSVGIPRVPKDVTVRNISSTKINVTWTTPELYTGPTSYTVTANDQDTHLHTRNISGFNSTSVNIDGLYKYWLYDITVTAYTSAGDNKTDVVTIRTAEDVPEQIKNLTLIPESDVTKIRSIKVKWIPLNERDKNGIITHYYVQYSFGRETLTKSLSSTSEEYMFSNIKPGNYTIKVFASTSIGNGADQSSNVTLEPGAPIKVPENPGQPLIQKSSVAVPDAETQIAVNLPVDTFLCNTTNGDPVEWGVIVSEESAATDKSFVGSRSNYEKTKNQYSKWKDSKGKEPMPPYIATDPEKFNPCGNEGSRRRRDTTSTKFQDPFIVGQDGECSDSSQQVYCNGELPPNRNFRVKSYVCTAGGCTETNYGPSIKTAPDPTVPIAAGISSAVVVIIVIVVVVTVMKRKQLVCFKKKDVETSTHQSGEGIEFDRMDSTKSTTSRPFTPGPIKLTDFPGRVEEMHKDSDLIFADAYKMLKEQSPSHPMTAAEAQCSRPKNRYTNILPFDHSRVKLRPSDDVEGSDYINANYIPGYTSRREYIATQGPMLATFDDFWRMIWEQNVDTIVMLTKLMENGRHKCDKYWPEVSEPVYYGDLVVSVLSESNLSDYTIRIIEVKLKEEVKKVHQFCYLKWPDMGCPDTPDLLIGFVNNVRNYTKRERSDKNSGPMIVHCSAGVGRTGTFIAVDTLLQHIRDHDEVDVFNLVKEMRNHRLNMVQTEDQYVYIHECLKAFINTDEDEEDHLYANGPLQEDEHIYENTAFSM